MVATAAHALGRPLDPVWRGFAARLVARSGASVAPLGFDGADARLFQIARHLHSTLRMARPIRAFGARVDGPVRPARGAPIGPDRLAPLARDPKRPMDFLRAATYRLQPTPVDPRRLGQKFEARDRRCGAREGRWLSACSTRGWAG